jgi:hypothetical protein
LKLLIFVDLPAAIAMVPVGIAVGPLVRLFGLNSYAKS